MRRAAARSASAAGALALGLGCALLGRQAFLHAKAELAAALIDRAWEAHLRDGMPHRPWSWADVAPIARLIAPRLGIDRPILSGAAGSALAFGLGHLSGTARPGRPGVCVLAGHRDTWASFLRDLAAGDEVVVRSRGDERRYRVVRLEIVDRSDASVLDPALRDRLVLVTCYPFDALRGGPLRYVVTCLPDPASPRPDPGGGPATRAHRRTP